MVMNYDSQNSVWNVVTECYHDPSLLVTNQQYASISTALDIHCQLG